MGNHRLRKRILTLSMAVLLLFLTAASVFSATLLGAEPTVVRMGYFEFGRMFEGASPEAEKGGYCYEYMMQLATYTGWKYEFVYGTYAELYQMLKEGTIDLLPYTNYNYQRAKEALFSSKELLQEEYYIAVPENSNLTLETLRGGVITTLSGADYNDLLKTFNSESELDLSLSYYPDLESTWSAVKNGNADATVFTSNAYSADGWRCLCSFGIKPTYIAIAKNRPDLLEQLNEATASIDIDNPALLGELYANYFSDNPMRRSLSADERAWLEAHPVLHVGGFISDAPYLLTVDNLTKTATGLSVDIVEEIIERLNLGITADYQGFTSIYEMEEALDRGDIDVIIPFYPSYTVASEHNLVLSNNVRTSNMELVFKTGTSYQEALQRVATPATKLGKFYVLDNFPQSRIVDATSLQDAVDKVRSGEATGAIGQNVMLHNIKEKYDELSYVVLAEGCDTCFAARPENYVLIRILNRGLNYFTNAEISAIASLYNPEPNVTTLAYLTSHKEAVVMLVMIFVVLMILAIALVQLNHMKFKADVASQAKTSFLFNMSHDIRTPMNAITGFTKMAKKSVGDDEKVAEYLDKIDISGQQLLTLVNQILEMARIESGKIDFELKPIDIRKEFEDSVTVLKEQAEANGLKLKASLENCTSYYVLADTARMNSITLNIVGNAMKYTPRGGSIDFVLRQVAPRKEGYASFVFSVKDTGIGMSKEFQKVMFDPFTREHNSTVSKIQGAGLGMSIVKNLVDLLEGDIEVQSELGKGTRFDVTIDFQICEAPEEPAVPVKAASGKFFSGLRVLLVEDNALNREIAVDLLEEEGMEVEEADDGTVAVAKLKEMGPKYYDFVLMDIQMPMMNGIEATKAIREMYPHDYLPIIALSANAFSEDRAASLAAGMDEHVAKPIKVEELKEVLAKFL